MAIITGPLFSLEAHGSLGDVLTYARLGRTNYTKVHFTPANPRSQKQVVRRLMTGWLTQTWSALSDSEKANFNSMATSWNLSPYHAWLKFNSQRWTSNLMPAKLLPTGFDFTPNVMIFNPTQAGNIWTINIVVTAHARGIFSLRLQAMPGPAPIWNNDYTVAFKGPAVLTGPFWAFSFQWTAPDDSMLYFRLKIGSSYGESSPHEGS